MRIGVDLGGTKIEGIVLSDKGQVVEKVRVNTPADAYDDTVAALCQLIESLQSDSKKKYSVGIGTPGTLSAPGNIMKNCNSICLNGEPLKKDVEKRLGYEVRMENDANCFTLSEASFGVAKNASTVFGVILGTGTGGGIVVNGRLLNGPNRIAGEWGHNSIPSSARKLMDSDRICYCGRTNCIETLLSGRGLTQTYLERTGDELDAVELSRLHENGDQSASDCIQIYCQQLACCLATVVNVIDPDMIVLGGGLSNIAELYRRVPTMMKDYVFTDEMLTELSAPSFGDASGARGAACLWSPA